MFVFVPWFSFFVGTKSRCQSEAGCTRIFTNDFDLEIVAREALDDACRFVSCFQADPRSAHKLKSELADWWTEIGQEILWGSLPEEEDEDEEEDLQETDDREKQELEQQIDSAEKIALVEEELLRCEDPDFVPAEDEADAASQPSDDEGDGNIEESAKLELTIMTLKDALKEAGLTKFEPKGGEHERNCLRGCAR